MTPEGKLKAEIKAFLKTLGPSCWWFMPVLMGYGVRGTPDFVGCYKGQTFGIEAKSSGSKQTKWQLECDLAISEAGGIYILAYSVDDVRDALGLS